MIGNILFDPPQIMVVKSKLCKKKIIYIILTFKDSELSSSVMMPLLSGICSGKRDANVCAHCEGQY